MKRIGRIWDEAVALDNLYAAYCKARKGKRRRPDVARFGLDLEQALCELQRQLVAGDYVPGAYRQFTIYERKPRVISVAPFRDRVVHHAVMNVLEPLLDKRFIPDSYACRQGQGRAQGGGPLPAVCPRLFLCPEAGYPALLPVHRPGHTETTTGPAYQGQACPGPVAQDIDNGPETGGPTHFFTGDDLVSVSERRRGLPIGNLTSQFLANLYLDGFDHWLKETMRVKAYLRYVDDIYLLGDDKERLWALREAIALKLQDLRLTLHDDKTHIYRTTERVDVLGYKVSRYRRWLRNDNGFRFRRRLKHMSWLYQTGEMDWPTLNASVQSWIGHARHAETAALREAVFSQVSFNRGAGLFEASA